MTDSRVNGGLILLHWPRFGPYHLARLRAARQCGAALGFDVKGLEIASADDTYLWETQPAHEDAPRDVLFPGSSFHSLSRRRVTARIFRRLNQLRPRAIFINGYGYADSLAVLSWCRLHRCPAVLMSESSNLDLPRRALREAIKRLVVPLFSAALVGGTPHKAYAITLGLDAKKVFVGYDAIDNEFFKENSDRYRIDRDAARDLPGLQDESPFFLASARLIKRKNIDGLIVAFSQYRKAANQLSQTHSPWRLVILGDGPERSALESLAASLETGGVEFAGFRQLQELPAYYGRAGAFVHPARFEPWGLVVNEAMASALPVIVSSACGCAADLVSDGETGFTFAPADTERLASLLGIVSSSPDLSRKMGLAARERVDRWGLERFAEGFAGALGEALLR